MVVLQLVALIVSILHTIEGQVPCRGLNGIPGLGISWITERNFTYGRIRAFNVTFCKKQSPVELQVWRALDEEYRFELEWKWMISNGDQTGIVKRNLPPEERLILKPFHRLGLRFTGPTLPTLVRHQSSATYATITNTSYPIGTTVSVHDLKFPYNLHIVACTMEECTDMEPDIQEETTTSSVTTSIGTTSAIAPVQTQATTTLAGTLLPTKTFLPGQYMCNPEPDRMFQGRALLERSRPLLLGIVRAIRFPACSWIPFQLQVWEQLDLLTYKLIWQAYIVPKTDDGSLQIVNLNEQKFRSTSRYRLGMQVDTDQEIAIPIVDDNSSLLILSQGDSSIFEDCQIITFDADTRPMKIMVTFCEFSNCADQAVERDEDLELLCPSTDPSPTSVSPSSISPDSFTTNSFTTYKTDKNKNTNKPISTSEMMTDSPTSPQTSISIMRDTSTVTDDFRMQTARKTSPSIQTTIMPETDTQTLMLTQTQMTATGIFPSKVTKTTTVRTTTRKYIVTQPTKKTIIKTTKKPQNLILAPTSKIAAASGRNTGSIIVIQMYTFILTLFGRTLLTSLLHG